MSRKHRFVFLLVTLVALLGIGRSTLGSFEFVFRDFWFSAGLLLVILLSVIDQPHFSTDSNVFLNGIAGLVALLTVLPALRDGFWTLFFAWSWYLIASSYLLMLRRSAPLSREHTFVQLISRVNRRIGRPEALFSAFFLWGIHTQFTTNSAAFAALMWFWAAFIVLDLPGVSEVIGGWLANLRTRTPQALGELSGFVSPRIVEAELSADAPAAMVGREVEIRSSSGASCAYATIIDDRVMSGRRRVRMGITETTPQWTQFASSPDARGGIVFATRVRPAAESPVSVVDKGSDIGTLRVRVNPALQLSDGQILWTQLPDGNRAFYQIVAASITEDSVIKDHGIHEVDVAASQLGRWVGTESLFEPITWVAPAGGLVYKGSAGVAAEQIPATNLKVGIVPHSDFPVHVRLDDVVTHNTAILGVTGSGKSYLSLHLVDGLVRAHVRVLVLDISRQYWMMLANLNPTPVRNLAELRAWLTSDSKLAVYQFADSQNYTLTTAEFVEACLKHLQDTVILRAGVNEPARICVVLKEAHSLIPEWNQVAVRDDTTNVNRTARAILQGRKFGMGCLVVSQRTANVTKTILNQCNTIAAFQCFDQTGLDFLGNYMGNDYARALSNLVTRHAIIVGKASSSKRPIRFLVDDFSTRWTAPVVAAVPAAPANPAA